MGKTGRVLLVEDNEGDIVLTTEALGMAGLTDVLVAMDGQQAIDMLNSMTDLPDIILLDINLPKVDGLEVLTMIKQSEKLKVIPVLVLTTSSSENDIRQAYHSHANCYIVKSADLDVFMRMIQRIKEFWINVVELPVEN